jgi:hypothetical protein
VDLAQTEFGPGMLRHLVVGGFDTGLDTPGNVSHVTIADLSLRNQNRLGIRNRFPMSICGLCSANALYNQWDPQRREPQPDREGWRRFLDRILSLDGEGRVRGVLEQDRKLVLAILDDAYLVLRDT